MSHSGTLELQFPWQDHPVEVPSPSSLTPREYKYLQWCLDQNRLSITRSRRLLSLLGIYSYRQVAWLKNQMKEMRWQ